MAKTIKITDEGLKKLEEELETLKTEAEQTLPKKLKLPAVTVTFPKTANMTRLKTNRQN